MADPVLDEILDEAVIASLTATVIAIGVSVVQRINDESQFLCDFTRIIWTLWMFIVAATATATILNAILPHWGDDDDSEPVKVPDDGA